MSKKTVILVIVLLLTIPLGEIYRYFQTLELRERNWFLLSDISQDIEWYIKDTSEALIWIIFLFVWYIKERGVDPLFASFIMLFLVYRIVDLIMYWVDFRQNDLYYGLCYLFILGIMTFNCNKKK